MVPLNGKDCLGYILRNCKPLHKNSSTVSSIRLFQYNQMTNSLAHILPCMRFTKNNFSYAKTKAQFRFAVTVKLISAFVFATWIAQFLVFLNPKFQASNHLLWQHRPVCVRPGQYS